MTPKDLLDYFGKQAVIARALGVAQPSVNAWFESGEVPMGRQYQVELGTKGQLRASKPAIREDKRTKDRRSRKST